MQHYNHKLPMEAQLFEACTALVKPRVEDIIKENPELDLNRPRERGRTLLTQCAEFSSSSITVTLISGGADPNLVDDKGDTPLEVAVWSERDDIVQTLLEHGADPDSFGKGLDHLVEVARERSPDCLAILAPMQAERDARRLDEGAPRATHNRAARF